MSDDGITDAHLIEAIRELEEIIDGVIPRAFQGPLDWRMVATGFLARFADQLRSMAILIEAHQYAEAIVVLRAIYEASVMFCWLGADSAPRVQEWIEHSDRSRISTFKEADDIFDLPAPEDVDYADLQKLDRLRPLSQLAREADEHWSERHRSFRPPAKGLEGLLTFSGFYTAVYRPLSRLAHAELEHLDSVARPSETQTVITREARIKRGSGSLGLCIPMVGLALMAYDDMFGGLDTTAIENLNQGMVDAAEVERRAKG